MADKRCVVTFGDIRVVKASMEQAIQMFDVFQWSK